MDKITSKVSLNKWVLMLILTFNFLISENTYSLKRWETDYIIITYYEEERYIDIVCQFIDYEYGRWGEHAYLELANFEFTVDGKQYEKLFTCQVYDHRVTMETSIVVMSNKLSGTKIQFIGCEYPRSGAFWPDNIKLPLEYRNISQKASFNIQWHLPPKITIKDFIIAGTWRVKGLNCSDDILVKYDFLKMKSLNSQVITDCERNYDLNQPEKNAVKVHKKANAVVVKGADRGENILVYTTSCTLVKSIIVNSDVVEIKLPSNQIYLVYVAQTHYKIVL